MEQNEAKCGGGEGRVGVLISHVCWGEMQEEEREDIALSELCNNRFHDLIGNLVNLLKHLVV